MKVLTFVILGFSLIDVGTNAFVPPQQAYFIQNEYHFGHRISSRVSVNDDSYTGDEDWSNQSNNIMEDNMMNSNSPSTATVSNAKPSSNSLWSVTDNWNLLSQSDNINYQYNENNSNDIMGSTSVGVLNSIDQVTLAALRMQNFGMSSPVVPELTQEERWIENSIQQIMVMDDANDSSPLTSTTNNATDSTLLNTDQFLDDMGNEIAMLVRCNENQQDQLGSLFMDECEILEDSISSSSGASLTTDKQGKSSYERVELIKGSNIPLYIKDGEFVFVDEQSCIGCMQCVTAAPGSFQMLEQGRARTFCQRNSPDVASAVASCPVDCMHYVSYDELKELEVARDVGVADDHRHFGHSSARGYIAPTPLHVGRRDSDANHKSSFYHYIQDKCSKSSSCPQRGCYDCPKFGGVPGTNPYFQEKLLHATHQRAEHFKETGAASTYRKIADL